MYSAVLREKKTIGKEKRGDNFQINLEPKFPS
jgi:hypothetical protein